MRAVTRMSLTCRHHRQFLERQFLWSALGVVLRGPRRCSLCVFIIPSPCNITSNGGAPFTRWAAHNFTPFHPCPSHHLEIRSPYNFFQSRKFFSLRITNLLHLSRLTSYVFLIFILFSFLKTNPLKTRVMLLFLF